MVKNILRELIAGFTVAIVALPLALAFGVAVTGTPEGAILGLYGAIFTGFFAAVFGGTPSQITGPTAPITVILTGIVAKYGVGHALLATIMAGGIQIIFGLLKFGKALKYITPPVISGFMNGIAILIILSQIEYLNTALFIVLLTICLMLFAKKFIKVVPDSLFALVISSAIAIAFESKIPNISFALPLIGEVSFLQNLEVVGIIPDQIPKIIIPNMSFSELRLMFLPALSIAILGSIDSLLTSVVMDNMTGKKHNSNKELIGQGIGNLIAGFFGGIAGAGATVRSVVNLKSGGKTALSGVFHSIVLLSFMLVLNKLVGHIPLAVLAGILIVTGFSMFDYDNLREIAKSKINVNSIIMIITMLLTVTVDLMFAVAVGVVLTFIYKKIFAAN